MRLTLSGSLRNLRRSAANITRKMEWKYPGKFTDKSPNIRAAGAPLKKCDKLSDCLKIYPVDDAIVTVLTEAGLHKVPPVNPPQITANSRHTGIYTGARKNLTNPTETRYKTLLRDLTETTWKSYWNKQLGRASDPICALPPRITDNEDFTFGILLKRDNPNAEELINPKEITPYEVVFNEAEYHKMYRSTHKDFYPGEQLNREYAPPYNRSQRYGSIPKRKASAICSMKLYKDQPLEMSNDLLADRIQHTHPKLGKACTPNNNIKCVPIGHRFGKKSIRPFQSVPDLIQPNLKTSLFKKDFYTWLSCLHEVRNTILGRKPDFLELHGFCTYADVNHSGWIDLAVFQQILLDKHLSFPHDELLPLLTLLGVHRNGQVLYEALLDLFNIKIELPDLRRFYGYKTDEMMTTSQFNRCMIPYKDNSKHPPAGVELGDRTKQERENLGNETRVGALINPSILTNYGLSHIDMLAPRKAEFIRKLFERIGYQFPDDTFDKLWIIGNEIDKDRDGVSVDTFKQIIEQAAPITIKDEHPAECFDIKTPNKCP